MEVIFTSSFLIVYFDIMEIFLMDASSWTNLLVQLRAF